MFKSFTEQSINKQMLFLAVLFIIINGVSNLFFDITVFRSVRLLSSITVLTYFVLKIGHHSKWVYVIFVSQCVSDVGFLFYDYNFGPYLFLLTSIITYLIYVIRIFKDIEWSKFLWYEIIAYIAMATFNCLSFNYLLNNLADLFESQVLFCIVHITGFVGITSCLICGLNNSTKICNKTSYYLYACIAFVCADFCAMVAHYYEFHPQFFYFLERGTYLFGLFILSKYALMDFKDHNLVQGSRVGDTPVIL
ncbi:MAG: hypothetical protein ABJM08_09745 [Nonlabens sp.]